MATFNEYVEQNRERFIAELQDFVRQLSVAAQKLGMREMADKVLAWLHKLGARARLIPKHEQDRILIEGYYEHVREPTVNKIEALWRIPFDEEAEKENVGIKQFINDLHGVELLHRFFYEPTCTICSIYSGYIGEGSKTVLPNHAFAKIEFRLVPNLTPDLVLDLLRNDLDRHGFGDIEIRQTENGEEVARSLAGEDPWNRFPKWNKTRGSLVY